MDSRNGNSKGIERTRKRVVSRRVASRFAGKRSTLCAPSSMENFSKKNEIKKKTSIDPVSSSETARSVQREDVYNGTSYS